MKTLKFHWPILHLSKSPCLLDSKSPCLLFSRSPLLLVSLSLLLLLSTSLFAQREADNWIFGFWAGLNFTTGDPVPILVNEYGDGFEGTIMSDSSGNILFYYSSYHVYNRNGQIMLNGDDMWIKGHGMRQQVIAFPKPGTDSQYYVFVVTAEDYPDGMYYSVVDMNLDGGLGGVTSEKNIKLDAAPYAAGKLFALKNSEGDGYWVITRLFNDDRYVSFRVTAGGVDPVPVYSSTGIYRLAGRGSGPMRVSPDKKYIISCFRGHPYSDGNIEVCSFDAITGSVGFKYILKKPLPHENTCSPMDCEISPDSKLLYICWIGGTETDNGLSQYNREMIEDSASFYDSGLYLLHNDHGKAIQLSNDGRMYFIYDTGPPNDEYQDKYLGVINKPWELGTACDIDTLGAYLGGRRRSHHLPNIMLDYLYRFEWTDDDYCQGSPVHFLPHFVPTPDSVKWFFDEFAPGSYSNELSPTYTFQNAGIHEVEVDIWYPTGRFEHTSREIEIFPTPEPDLGPDILICEGTSDTLYANCDADFYTWNGIPGISQYTVSDSGTYRVLATFLETGCTGSDTIHIGFHSPTIIDETNLVITPTTCNGASGLITGLYALGTTPYAYQWLDLSGNDYGTNIDATNLPAGQYQLSITDGNGCETISEVYTIEDAGDLQVTQVQTARPHCFSDDGQIVVHAFSPSGSILEYSIDAGVNYQYDSVFSGLFAMSYAVQVKDENGCSGFYLENPVLLEDVPGPQVQPPVVTDETDFLGNGSIEITATASTPVIYYSIDSGNTYQSNNGTFNNLGSGIYDCMILDQNGCDTSFTVEIQNVILTYLQAVTGEDGLCEDSAALIPVTVDNFNSVANFHLKLGYNADNLQCEGFINVHPQLLDSLTGWVDQAIHLTWKSPTSVTFTGTEKVADLVFTTKNPGQGELAWYTGTTESYFTNAGGNLIPAEFQAGTVDIYAPPVIFNTALTKTACIGQMVSFTSFAGGNQPPLEYLWTYPDGHQDESDPFIFAVTQADAGEYILVVTDNVGCSDQQIVQLIVSENPVAAFHGTDTLEMQVGDVLDAGSGLASYRWSLGDTTQSIVIQEEGKYLVEMESQFGCIGSDSVYVKLKEEVIPPEPNNKIFIPNAFSPDGDGVNDNFNIRYNNNSFPISHFVLHIFNRWGEEIYESTDITQGWDGKKAGKDCPGGVYVYKIVFSVEGVAGKQERVGTVMLVR